MNFCQLLLNKRNNICSPFFVEYCRADTVTQEQKTVLTMYTKDNCSLCDVLVDELEPFRHRIVFEKIDITKHEKYFDLYHYDIPVLHLNGEYLCKHRLNARLLAKRLDEIDKRNTAK